MELLQLKYFCDAAICQNFSQTAKKFGVPPSDISQSIKRLEKELGTHLFSRFANRIILNDNGREFYYAISKALVIIADAVATASDEEGSGNIKLCVNTNRRVVMEAIEKYRNIYPNVEIVTMHFTDPTSEDFDMIIESEDDRLSSYEKRLMITEEIMLATKHDSSLAKCTSLDISALKDVPFVTMGEKSSLYNLTASICKDYGFKPRIAMKSDDPFYVRKCVELGLGVTFVPEFSWRGQFSSDVVLKKVEGYTRNTYIYTDPKKHIPTCAKRFLEMLITEIKQ